ncbi:DUF2511 domain-containing protein [Nocardioides acrostichi]|uniref:DUF2511 domain-containing protein n=1 Tax=Nocardioides acrostichi TaxID=2784339 RepID=A0A930V060_9ACTN|nr:DUF2511 domain-containing protein [Nocardioides acrostichi]MBF4161446.1 DUF2511 domain-containing protein [Nocardioides acrostichi]
MALLDSIKVLRDGGRGLRFAGTFLSFLQLDLPQHDGSDAEPSDAEPADVPKGFRDDPGLVTAASYGDGWPLTVEYGALTCRIVKSGGREASSVTIRVPGAQYALNGVARSMSPFQNVDPIWADNPDIKGAKLDLGPFIERGLELCE